MPRRTPVRELQKEEPVPSSPLRRSSRLNTNSPVPTKVLARRNSATEAATSTPKATRGRRSSLSQDVEIAGDILPEKKTPAATRSRRGSTSSNIEEEQLIEKTRSVAKETTDAKKTRGRGKYVSEDTEVSAEEPTKKVTRARSGSITKNDTDDNSTTKKQISAKNTSVLGRTPVKKSPPESNVERMDSVEEEKDEDTKDSDTRTKKKKIEVTKIDLDLSVINEASFTEEEATPEKKTKTNNSHLEVTSDKSVETETSKKSLDMMKNTQIPQIKITEEEKEKTIDNSDCSFTLQISPTVAEKSNKSEIGTSDSNNKENISPRSAVGDTECEPMDVDTEDDISPLKFNSTKSPKSLITEVEQKLDSAKNIVKQIDQFLDEEIENNSSFNKFKVGKESSNIEKLQKTATPNKEIIVMLERDVVVEEKQLKEKHPTPVKDSARTSISPQKNVGSSKGEVKRNSTSPSKDRTPTPSKKTGSFKREEVEEKITTPEKRRLFTTRKNSETPKEITVSQENRTNSPNKKFDKKEEVEGVSTRDSNKVEESGNQEVPQVKSNEVAVIPSVVSKDLSSSKEISVEEVQEVVTKDEVTEDQEVSKNDDISMTEDQEIQEPSQTANQVKSVILKEIPTTDGDLSGLEDQETQEAADNVNVDTISIVSDKTEDSTGNNSTNSSLSENTPVGNIPPSVDKQTNANSELNDKTDDICDKPESDITDNENLEAAKAEDDDIEVSVINEKIDRTPDKEPVTNIETDMKEEYASPVKKVRKLYIISDDETNISKNRNISFSSNPVKREDEYKSASSDEDLVVSISEDETDENVDVFVTDKEKDVDDVAESNSSPKIQNNEAKTDSTELSLLSQSLRRRSSNRTSITLQETIKAGDDKEENLSERIHKVVDLFCAGIKNEADVSINVSLEYAGQCSDSDSDANCDKNDVVEISMVASDITEQEKTIECPRGSKRRKIYRESLSKAESLNDSKSENINEEEVRQEITSDDEEEVSDSSDESISVSHLYNKTFEESDNDVSWKPSSDSNDLETTTYEEESESDCEEQESVEEQELVEEQDAIEEEEQTKTDIVEEKKEKPKKRKLLSKDYMPQDLGDFFAYEDSQSKVPKQKNLSDKKMRKEKSSDSEEQEVFVEEEQTNMDIVEEKKEKLNKRKLLSKDLGNFSMYEDSQTKEPKQKNLSDKKMRKGKSSDNIKVEHVKNLVPGTSEMEKATRKRKVPPSTDDSLRDVRGVGKKAKLGKIVCDALKPSAGKIRKHAKSLSIRPSTKGNKGWNVKIVQLN